MPWARLDDGFWSHPKTMRLADVAPEAGFLHIRAISYSTRHMTDGFLSDSALTALMPDASERARATEVLVEEGVWYRDGDKGYVIHDFLDWNPSRAQIMEKRLRDRERKAQNA